VLEAVGSGVTNVLCFVRAGGSSPSRQPPNQPGYWQDDVEVGDDEVVVAVGAGAGVVLCEMWEEVEAVVFSPLSSLQPNQPGVLHVDVEVVGLLCEVEEDVMVPVVVSSRQPHHPGVLHVSVLVRVLILLVGFDIDVDVGFEV
jgi:hypothetical protein